MFFGCPNSDFQRKHSVHSHDNCLQFHSPGDLKGQGSCIWAERCLLGPCNRLLEEDGNGGKKDHFWKVLKSRAGKELEQSRDVVESEH